MVASRASHRIRQSIRSLVNQRCGNRAALQEPNGEECRHGRPEARSTAALARQVSLRLAYPACADRYRSTPRAAFRPSAIAQTTSDCPRRMSPAAKTPASDVM